MQILKGIKLGAALAAGLATASYAQDALDVNPYKEQKATPNVTSMATNEAPVSPGYPSMEKLLRLAEKRHDVFDARCDDALKPVVGRAVKYGCVFRNMNGTEAAALALTPDANYNSASTATLSGYDVFTVGISTSAENGRFHYVKEAVSDNPEAQAYYNGVLVNLRSLKGMLPTKRTAFDDVVNKVIGSEKVKRNIPIRMGGQEHIARYVIETDDKGKKGHKLLFDEAYSTFLDAVGFGLPKGTFKDGMSERELKRMLDSLPTLESTFNVNYTPPRT